MSREQTRMNPPLKLLSREELTSLQFPPRFPILGDWLTDRHQCMVYAQTGRGKSLFSMSIAMAVAGGGSVFGWDAPEARPVLYVDAEMDLADLMGRDALLSSAVEGVDEGALNKNLLILARHGQPDGVVFPDIVDEEGREALLELVEEHSPCLVILDNLSTLAEIRDENDAASFAPVLKILWELRQRGCAVLLVHHTGKQEGRFRGSSKLAATFESILQLAINGDLLTGDTGFTIKVDKFRGGKPPESTKVRLDVDPETGAGHWNYGGLQERQLQELLQVVRSRGFFYAKDMGPTLGISSSEITKRKHEAIRAGLITEQEWNQCFLDARATGREFDGVDLTDGFSYEPELGDDFEGGDFHA